MGMMKILTSLVLLTCCSLAFAAKEGRRELGSRRESVDERTLVAGEGRHDALEGQYPWMVELYDDDFPPGNEETRTGNSHNCGATLIHERVLLTAAHCFTPEDDQDADAPDRPGSINTDTLKIGNFKRTQDRDDPPRAIVLDYRLRNSIETQPVGEDIALILLGEYDGMGDVATVTLGLCESAPEDTRAMTILGWAAGDDLDTEFEGVYETLQECNFMEQCSGGGGGGGPNQVCVRNTEDLRCNVAIGDSGGPIFIFEGAHFHQIGVIVASSGTATLGAKLGSSDNVAWMRGVFEDWGLTMPSVERIGCKKFSNPNPLPCFSSANTVEVVGKGIISIEGLRIGDLVKTSEDGDFSRVYSFAHKDHNKQGEYLQIYAGKSVVEISSQHMLFANGKVARAGNVKVGDKLSKIQKVTKIKTVKSRGLFAPLTNNGEIVVSGVRTSTYVAVLDIDTSLQVIVYHAILFPLRLLCGLNISMCKRETYIDGVSDKFYKGLEIGQFVRGLNSFVQLGLVLVSWPILAIIASMDWLLPSPILLAMFVIAWFVWYHKVTATKLSKTKVQ